MPRKKAVRLALVAACAGILAALVVALVLHLTTQTAKQIQPRHTATPATPGISIAQENFDLPDPFILTDKKKYYLYLSTAFGNTTQNIPMFSGSPGHWSAHSIDAVPVLPAWAAPGLTWAPAVYRFGGHYVMYFSSLGSRNEPLAALHRHRHRTDSPMGRSPFVPPPSSASRTSAATSTRSSSSTLMVPTGPITPTISCGRGTTTRPPGMAQRRFGPSR